ncbi:hypothetical protein AX16_003776 [Volvariella volvacea WC 439]|nr:hypothetical protein AX16_003776 [Volvariella volvacea WC 439]
MSDSFADLWNSTAPSRPTGSSTSNQKLGSGNTPKISIPLSGQRRAQQDVFSMLASANATTPATPSPRPNTLGQPQRNSPLPTTRFAARTGTGGPDAFSGLFGSSSGLGKDDAKLTMAERAAKVQREQLERIQGQRQQSSGTSTSGSTSAWAGLDSLASLSSASKATVPQASKSSNAASLFDDWGPDSTPLSSSATQPAQSAKPSVRATASKDDDDWGLDFASTKSTQPIQPSTSRTTSTTAKPQGLLWDLDELTNDTTSSQRKQNKEPAHFDSPGDFDFGDREDRVMDKDSDDEDDILGDLAKPVDAVKRSSSRRVETPPHTTPSPSTRGPERPTTRAVSPPPHILGQLVEMGFSVQQARVALASTDTGLDVQAALEVLLANGAADGSRHSTPQPPNRDSRQERRPSNRPETTRRATRDSPAPVMGERNLQEQADKILAQASEIGLNMFNRANALWKEGREKVQKAYEERTGGSSTGGGARPDGRPRWMQEAPSSQVQDDDGWGDRPVGAFSDDVEVTERERSPKRAKAPKPPPAVAPESAPAAQRGDSLNLFGDAPVVYTSRFRHGRSKPTPSAPQSSAPPARATPPPAAAPSVPRPVPRQNVVSATQAAISNCMKHKEAGTAKFKLGQYGESESCYTLAISALPSSHLLLIPLYNNRALTRLKNGDYKGAAEDASSVLEIAGEGYHPSLELKVEKEEEGLSVDIADGIMKALKRRAEAWEGREKWEDAVKDWEKLSALDWLKSQQIRNEAIRGAVRCRRMTKDGQGSSGVTGNTAGQGGLGGLEDMMEVKVKPRPPAPSKPKPAAAPPRKPVVTSNKPSEALANLRNANSKAEAEEQARYELKDVVDQKLLSWKGGKETNIRALLASLDTVLWPELGLPKLGMADLVTPAQVKVKYTRTIAKLHPDKLNTSNTTVEQRMIANGVFGALNEAWNAFKQ